MKKLIEQLNAILTGGRERALELRELKIGFVRKQKEMLHSLQLCKKSGGIIGIYSPVLGPGMLLCSVLQILHDKTLIIRPIDPNEAVLSKSLLDVSEITCICPFNQVYDHASAQTEEDDYIPSQLDMFQNVN